MSAEHRRQLPTTNSDVAVDAPTLENPRPPAPTMKSDLTEEERQRRRLKLADDIRHGRLDVPIMTSEEFDALRREMWIREP